MVGWGHRWEQKALEGVQLLIVTSTVAVCLEMSSAFTPSHLLEEGVVSNNYTAAILSNEIVGFLHSKR